MLYLVPTPIGNLGDVSRRIVEVLSTAQILAAEDTRSARRLLQLLEIPLAGRLLLCYGDHNEMRVATQLVPALQEGKSVAVLSEGGTPLVSDPGYRLVQEAIRCGVEIVPLPGPSAILVALCGSGLPVHAFSFHGFLPKKSGQRMRLLQTLALREETTIFFESPQRILKVLPDLAVAFGPERQACLARELTKKHETFVRGSIASIIEKLAGQLLKGECTLLVGGRGREMSQIESITSCDTRGSEED